MLRYRRRWTWASLIAVLMFALVSLAFVQSGPALAAVSANDNFANATPISMLPFADGGDLNGTTTEPGEPQPCGTIAQSAWYSFTPASDMVVSADTNGSDSGVGFSVYEAFASGFSGLNFISCVGYSQSFALPAHAGVTYYYQVTSVQAGAAAFQFHAQQILPPANDDFANATQVGTLPFSDTVSHPIAATLQPGEPPQCSGGSQSGSVWWAFTPSVTESYTAVATGTLGSGFTTLAAYQGSSLGSLSRVSCATFSPLTFHAIAGVTYYIRASGPWTSGGGDFPFTLQFDVTPPPVAGFNFQPSDPSIFDNVQFLDLSYDLGGVGIQSQAWTFGDGATATGAGPTHQYAKDGNYTVGLTVTTADGRTASTSQVVQVSTHDVAIVNISVPKTVHVGHTIPVNVNVRNTRYPEMVEVDLLKSVPGGFQQVGSLDQSVPVRSGKRTTLFAFTQTITQADKTIGKVSYKAVAIILGHRDALPADNELISPPVKVT
jgi:hypothetical protein